MLLIFNKLVPDIALAIVNTSILVVYVLSDKLVTVPVLVVVIVGDVEHGISISIHSR